MSYANYQYVSLTRLPFIRLYLSLFLRLLPSYLYLYRGKEALVEKFKNSCIMDEREAWRPKIFYSFGPNQGLPEPFPAPTHIRRKERSSFNRGALYVPGLHTRNNIPGVDDHRSHPHMGSRGGRKGQRSGVAAA